MSEIGANLVRFAVIFVLAAVALWFAIAFWSVLIVMLAWDTWGWKILALLGFLQRGHRGPGVVCQVGAEAGQAIAAADHVGAAQDRDALLMKFCYAAAASFFLVQ
jgi:hypothetical protein